MRILPVQGCVRAAIVVLAGLTVAGCNTSGQPTASLATPSGPAISGPSVAFESIDGPPPGVFHKLVQNLNDEATTRQLPVVSRQGSANYRIRGYLAAHVANNRTSYAWVWDVYDSEQRRALRISGEVPGSAAGGDAWNGADDAVLRKIAQNGMERVATFIASPTSTQMASAPAAPAGTSSFALASATPSADTVAAPDVSPDQDNSRQVVAQHDDFSPEAAGIFRLWRPGQPATVADAAPVVARTAAAEPAVPLPRQRPAQTARKPAAVTLAAAPDAALD